jgi:hypothetical protein
MARVGLLLLALPLLSCRHEFPPPASGDADDRDPDAALAIDQRAGDRGAPPDRSLPDAAAATCAAVTGPAGDCAKEESWGCVGVCSGKYRYACLKSPVQREIQCAEGSPCECVVDGKTTICSGLDNGRFGCDRGLEALRQGCCTP